MKAHTTTNTLPNSEAAQNQADFAHKFPILDQRKAVITQK
jgi:hypothetical protein